MSSTANLEPGSRDPVGPIAARPFGKYFLVRKLAEGGMAEIFLAKQIGVEGFEKNIVLKRMLSHLSAVPDFVSMFLDEARLASRLAHPNIVQIHDLGFEEGCYFIAMEYLAGEDFSTVVRSHARARQYVPLNVVVRVVAEASHGLHYAHDFTDAKGVPLHIVHRDVSPSNVFVTYTGQVKVLDFGIAKAESRLTQTTSGVVKGKYQYMAPEQAGSGLVDRRADVYSLGVCLYESLTNYRPFARDTDLAILNAVLKNEYRRPRDARPDLPPELEHIIVKALAQRPEDRYQSAVELALELEGYLRSMTSSSSATALSQFMTHYFGPERVAARTRIETLHELRVSAGISVLPSPGQPPRPSRPDESGVTNLSVEGKTPTIGPPRSSARRRRFPAVAVGLATAALATVIGGTVFATRALNQSGEPNLIDAGAAAVISAPDAAQAIAPVDASASTADAAVALPEERDAGPRPLPPRPVILTVERISKVVKEGQPTIVKCFQQYRDQLPNSQGQIGVTFTIARNGRVVKANSQLPNTNVGRCLEERVKLLRFPPHLDSEITVTQSFGYELQGDR